MPASTRILVCGAALALATSAPARANPITAPTADPAMIASSLDDDNPFDLHLSVGWEFKSKRSKIRREAAGQASDVPGALAVVPDLEFQGSRHLITPRVAIGLGPDIELSAALPITLTEDYDLLIDASATRSPTLDDGLLPTTGFDTRDPDGPGFSDPNDRTIFNGVERSGLDQIHLGAAWAPFNQLRDPTKPTWKVGATVLLSLGNERIFVRANPERETGVGSGLNEIRLWTSVAKRVGNFEPFVMFWWQAPISTTSDSQFIEVGFGAEREQAQQHAGTRFGVEGVFYEDVKQQQRVGLELSALVETNFDGRAYTEMWEVFAFAGDAAFDDANMVLDADPVANGLQALNHPGVTNVENYLTLAGRASVTARIGEFVQFAVNFELEHDTDHIISFADAGIDLPTCGGTLTTNCEDEDNVTVDPGTSEVNPYQVGLGDNSPAIDVVGNRYRVEDSVDFNIGASAMFLF